MECRLFQKGSKNWAANYLGHAGKCVTLHWRVEVRACVMDEKELEMLDKVLRTANLVHLRDKFVSEKVLEMLLCRNYSALVDIIYLLELMA